MDRVGGQMVVHELIQVDERAGDGGAPDGYTIDELARKVAMSARNIRAHQARRLLPPPRRAGRMALYDDEHVRRLESIKRLQRQGFNLAAIEAVLGVGRVEPGLGPVRTAVGQLGAEDPDLVPGLSHSMHLLTEILDWIRHVADEVFAQATARILALHPSLAGVHAFEEFERAAVNLTQGLVALLTEAFRVAVEAAGRSSVADLLALRASGEPQLAD